MHWKKEWVFLCISDVFDTHRRIEIIFERENFEYRQNDDYKVPETLEIFMSVTTNFYEHAPLWMQKKR